VSGVGVSIVFTEGGRIMVNRRRTNDRRGFTLTEMLVATALTMFIMAIISAAYRAGLDTFSKLNTANQLQQKLTNASKIIERDLGADHFDGPYGPVANRGGPKLSDQRLDLLGWRPPAVGYFYLYQGEDARFEPETSVVQDGENLGSSRNTTCGLSFTLRHESREYTDQFSGRTVMYTGATSNPKPPPPFVYNNTCFSNWAQAHYFLTGTGTYTEFVNGQQLELFALRRQ
jgi:hypothetical protein